MEPSRATLDGCSGARNVPKCLGFIAFLELVASSQSAKSTVKFFLILTGANIVESCEFKGGGIAEICEKWGTIGNDSKRLSLVGHLQVELSKGSFARMEDGPQKNLRAVG